MHSPLDQFVLDCRKMQYVCFSRIHERFLTFHCGYSCIRYISNKLTTNRVGIYNMWFVMKSLLYK